MESINLACVNFEKYFCLPLSILHAWNFAWNCATSSENIYAAQVNIFLADAESAELQGARN